MSPASILWLHQLLSACHDMSEIVKDYQQVSPLTHIIHWYQCLCTQRCGRLKVEGTFGISKCAYLLMPLYYSIMTQTFIHKSDDIPYWQLLEEDHNYDMAKRTRLLFGYSMQYSMLEYIYLNQGKRQYCSVF